MKFIVDHTPRSSAVELTSQQLVDMLRPEFERVGAQVNLVSLDVHVAATEEDSPFESRPYSERVVVAEIADLDTLTRYTSDTGRTVLVMAASEWSSADSGQTTLTHRLFVSGDGYCERDEQ
jgi:hypothetical protein